MKKFILYALIVLGSFAGNEAYAQPGAGNEKVEALYIAYVTRQLSLSEDEAQKFWPVHAQYENDMKGINMDQNELDRQQAMLNVKKKYQDKFTKLIGSDRTNKFFATDAEFRRRMIERLKKIRNRQ